MKIPLEVLAAAKRMAKANSMTVDQVLATYRRGVKKTHYSGSDFLLPNRVITRASEVVGIKQAASFRPLKIAVPLAGWQAGKTAI